MSMVTPSFLTEMQTLYQQLDTEVAARVPICVNRGLCCNFGKTGHRLYVTSVEWAYFLAGPCHEKVRYVRPIADLNRCPYQVDGRCVIRACRPMGCRIYYCDEKNQDWQNELYEQFQIRLIQIGERFGFSYTYQEWLTTLETAPFQLG